MTNGISKLNNHVLIKKFTLKRISLILINRCPYNYRVNKISNTTFSFFHFLNVEVKCCLIHKNRSILATNPDWTESCELPRSIFEHSMMKKHAKTLLFITIEVYFFL